MRKARHDRDGSRHQPVPVRSTTSVEVELAGSVVMLRDGPQGVETLLLERPQNASFAPGALVFPGGKVNRHDGTIDALATRDVSLPQWQSRLNVDTPHTARAILAAAIRETFEETGVLLACDENHRPIAQPAPCDNHWTSLRQLPDDETAAAWTDVLHQKGLLLDADRLTLLSWWITPHGYPRRFDTRFFAVRLPDDATVTPAAGEIVSAAWLHPATALQAAQHGSRHIIYPTRKNLAELAGHNTTAEAIGALARRVAQIRPLCPQLVTVNGRSMVVHPDGGEPEDE